MLSHDKAIQEIEHSQQIIGKKRKYQEAMDKENDYEVVQEPSLNINNRGTNWTDAYIENLNK
jgi:hypothetical protein